MSSTSNSEAEDNEDNEISRNLRNGRYTFTAPTNQANKKPLKSPVWKIWNWIVDEQGGIIYGKIGCVYCNTVRNYEGTSEGTSNLKRHEESCVKILKRRFLRSRIMK